MALHPVRVPVDPILQEVATRDTDAPILLEQSIGDLNERLGLAQRRHVEICERVPQVLLRDGGTDSADGCTEDARRFSRPRTVTVGSRGIVDGVLEDTGDGTIVFRR